MRANLARHGHRLQLAARQTRTASTSSCAAYAAPSRCRRGGGPTPPLASPASASASVPAPPPPSSCPRTFRRSFLDGIFEKPPREVRAPEYEPGWMQIMVWRSRMLEHVRPQSRKELRDAWKRLMEFKLRHRTPLNSTQALQCRRLLEYLIESREDGDAELSGNEISMARQILVDIEPFERTQNHLDFARTLHDVWARGDYARAPRSQALPWGFLVRAMCAYGGSREGLRLFLSKSTEPEYATYLAEKDDSLLEAVARGLAREGLEEELLELAQHVERQGDSCGPEIQAIMVEFYAQRDRVAETQHWFDKFPLPRPEVFRTIASFAMRNNLEQWAADILLQHGQMLPRKKHWDVLFQAILITGRGLEEVDTLMSHMMHRQVGIVPDIATINGLLGVAAETGDAPLAEAILALAASKDIAPDGETYLILMQLRLRTGDLAAFKAAHDEVKHLEPWTEYVKEGLYADYRRLTNEYLAALCAQPRPDFKHISSLLESVDEEQLRLAPATVATLCLRFLENDQHFEVMDLLAAYSFLYSEAERELVQDALVGFCLAPRTSTNRAWAAYQLLYQFFQDTSPEKRVDLMDGFFARRRPDMAAQVFGHMRAHRNRAYHPRPDTYVRCLEGLARYPDPDGLDMVHNMLKMDVTAQPSTRLGTALMLAYTACGRPLLALDFWHEITQSREGPSYESLEAVFWALERKPGGHTRARDLWDRIERMDLELTPGVYNAYIGAIAGNGNEKEVRGLVAKMAHAVGSEPDAMTLGIAYNALPTRDLQTGFEEWAKPRYRDAWAALLKTGRHLTEYSLCQFRIQRPLKA